MRQFSLTHVIATLPGARLGVLLGVLSLTLLALGCEKKADETPAAEQAKPENITWRADHDAALAAAKKEGKPVVIDFTAQWCAPCVRLEKETFSDAAVISAMQRFVAVRVDGTESIETVEGEMNAHGVASFPTVVFVNSRGETMSDPRLEDFAAPADFLRLLEKVE